MKPERVALVTGAARGIGAAVVRRLAADGYAVLALDWCSGPDAEPYPMPTESDLDAVASGHDGVRAFVADVRDRDALGAAVTAAQQRWGRLDVAVAAAAVIAGGKPLWETTAEELDLLWEIDAKGVWNTAAATVPAMLAGPDPRGCRFVAIASAASSHGLYHLAAYNAAKHAVIGIVRGLAADLVATGVTAVAVSPGSTDTTMLRQTAALYPDATIADLVGHQLLRRPITPEEIAATVAFCCTPEGSVLNGGVVQADGGFRG
ncbi:mycofactocin-coupled SDR family oxidoreductase [Amycolatopsis lurida]